MPQTGKIRPPKSRKQANPVSEAPQIVHFEQIATLGPLSGVVAQRFLGSSCSMRLAGYSLQSPGPANVLSQISAAKAAHHSKQSTSMKTNSISRDNNEISTADKAKPSPSFSTWWLLVIATGSVFLGFGITGWPGLHWDAVLFAPTILNVARGEGWQFNSYHFSADEFQLLLMNNRPYNAHGVLNILILGRLLNINSYSKLFFMSGIINALTFLSYSILFRNSLPFKKWQGIATSLIFGIMAGMIGVGLQGRPEHLIPLLVSLPLWARALHLKHIYNLLICAIITGVVFIASPLPGILLGAGIFVLMALMQGDYHPRFWAHMILFAIVALGSAALTIEIFCPFSFLAWLRNLSTVREGAMDMTQWLLRPRSAAGSSMYAPLWNLTVIAGVVSATLALARKKCFASLIVMWIILARVLPKANDYGYAGFLPAMVLIICHHIFLSTENRKLDTTFFNQPWLILLSGVATLYLLGFAKVVQQTIQQWNSPSTFAAAKASIAELTAGIGGRATAIAYPTMFTPSFVALAQPSGPRMIGSTWPESQPWGSLHPMDSFEKSQNIRIQYYLLPRKVTSLGQTPPPSIYLGRGKYTLISNQWAETGTAIPILSNLLKQYSQNYQFAVYRRIP